jgi:hypothetical protein
MRAFVLSLLLVAGCHRDPAIAALDELKERGCGCRDQPCVDAVLRELDGKTAALKETAAPDQARRLGADILVCLGRARDQAAAAAAEAAAAEAAGPDAGAVAAPPAAVP